MDINQLISQGEPYDFLFFWGHTDHPYHISKACLSQWYPCSFTYQGHTFGCAEQYMMARKAALMGDEETFTEILATPEPDKVKKLGRKVRNFDSAKWDHEKFKVVFDGNYLKFSQNPELKEFLLSTGNKILVEASPYDTIWGIGLSADDPRALDPRQWRGQNLLGFALMEVRQILRRDMRSDTITEDNVRCGVTPNHVSKLAPNEIFVFGSNLHGMHGGGAARIARQRFGAIMGVGVGPQGQSYAIPTMQGPVDTIAPYVDQFIEYAQANPQQHFLVTRIGCGIAGFTDWEIAPLFAEAVKLSNVSLPAEFIRIITSPQ